jgi:trimeric autotransporter adhesin
MLPFRFCAWPQRNAVVLYNRARMDYPKWESCSRTFSRSVSLTLAALFFLIVLSSPSRFAYAQDASPQSNPLSSLISNVEHAAGALWRSAPPLSNAAPISSQERQTRSALKDAKGAQVASVITAAAQTALHAAGSALSGALSQTASLWSAWVFLANSDIIAPAKIASVPSTAAVIVSQTGANAPPASAAISSVLPTPHLFPLPGASSGQSMSAHSLAGAGAVLGTSTEISYVTQDQLTAQIEQATNALRTLIYQNESVPNSLPASGGYTNEIALTNDIDQLNGTTLTNVVVNGISGLTAADIPTDITAANYLPLSGGTLTGALDISTTTATSTVEGNFKVDGTLEVGPASAYLSETGLTSAAGNFTISTGGDDNSSLSLQTLGRVGVSSSTPWGVLSVEHNGANASMPIFVVSQEGTTTAPSAFFTVDYLGHVGVGTSSPADEFAVNGATYLANITAPPVTTNRLYSSSGNLYWAGSLIGGGSVGNWSADGTNVWRTGGNVGIGTTSPFTTLSVNGSGFFGGNVNATSITATGTVTATNLLLNGSTTLQNFTALLATTSNATSTSFFATTASSTNLFSSLATLASATINALAANSLTLGSLNGPLQANAGVVSATSSIGVLYGGTGSTTLSGLLLGNGTAALNTATIGSGLSLSGTVLSNTGVLSIGPVGQTLTGNVTLATSTNTQNGLTSALTIVGSGSTHTFTPSLSGTLTAGGGGTGIGNPSVAGILLGSYAGGSWQQLATSSLGLLTTNVAEGSNLYFTNARAQGALSVGNGLFYGAGQFSLNLANANSWTALQQFLNASTSLFSAYGPAYFGSTATSSFAANGALTLAQALAIQSGGTGTTTGGTTNGVEYFNGTTLTNNSLLKWNGVDTLSFASTSATISANTNLTLSAFNNGQLILNTVGNQSITANSAANFAVNVPSGVFAVNGTATQLLLQAAWSNKTVTIGDGNSGNASQETWTLKSNNSNGNVVPQDLLIKGSNAAGSNRNGGNIWIAGGSPNGSGSYGNIVLGYDGSSYYGNVGVSSSTPWGLLSENANALAAGTPQFVVGSSTATNFIVANNGNVGIGTTSPSQTFSVQGNVSMYGSPLTIPGSQLVAGAITLTGGSANPTQNQIGGPVNINGGVGWGGLGVGGAVNITGGANTSVGGAGGSVVILGGSAPSGTAGNVLLATTRGLVGIGTSSPYSALTIWGPDTSGNTAPFTISNSASTTELQVFDNGNATLAGTLTQNSDQRLKTNVQTLNASDTLALIDQLNPVTFNWIDPSQGSSTQVGFIAQQVQTIFPQLVSTTSATALTPDGTLGLNYIGLISPVVSAIQELSSEVQNLIATVQGFAQSVTSAVGNFGKVNTQQLCITDSAGTPVCVTGDQLAALLATQGQQQTSSPASASTNANDASPTPETPPTVTIDGDNPAVIDLGDSYADLGASVNDTGLGQAGETNLSYKTFLNGALVSNIVIDTSAVAIDTIDYVATDSYGNTATSTRTVVVELGPTPSMVPTDNAPTTIAATSTATVATQ